MFYTTTLLRWLQRKRYQYEVTFSLYMLTPTEKFIFSTSFPPSLPTPPSPPPLRNPLRSLSSLSFLRLPFLPYNQH